MIPLCLAALGLRLLLIPNTNIDVEGYERWYDFILRHGRFLALGKEFAIYTPPYLYLLSLATLTESFLPRLTAIKLIPVFFDFINAFIVFKIVRFKDPAGNWPWAAAGIFLFTPTIWMNSALWGQIDSLYTCFLLICLYCVLSDKPIPAVIAFGAASAIKAQAVFMVPFLFLLAIKKKIPWPSFFLIPIVYLGMMVPSILAGRPLLGVFTVYLGQANEFQIPSFNSPNWYVLVPQSAYHSALLAGLTTAIAVVSVWLFVYGRKKFVFTPALLVFTGLVSVALVPFILPKMHDRYFYPADVFSLLLMFYRPKFWFIAVAYQVISILAYSVFLFDAPRQVSLILALQLNTFVLAYLLWKQSRLVRDASGVPDPTRVKS
ncbi:MAG: hypothetical protein HFACDABA_01392 [Anaerolineales bacterium]|nr:hypothetical protein [Anaerolineales bacterium]